MSSHHEAAEHHSEAAIHHDCASQAHNEAARHYENGRDYAQAAHQALIAHGHTLHALDHSHAAARLHVAHDVEPPYIEAHHPAAAQAAPLLPALNGADHHTAAAHHHDQAAEHHRQASEYCDRGEKPQAERASVIATLHTRLAMFHGNEAAKHYVARAASPDLPLSLLPWVMRRSIDAVAVRHDA